MGCGSSKDTIRKFRGLLTGIEKEVRELNKKTADFNQKLKTKNKNDIEPQSGTLQSQVTVRMKRLDEGIQEIQRSGKL